MKRKLYIFIIALILYSCSSPTEKNPEEITLEKKIGQMLVIGFRGLEVNDTSRIVKDIKEGKIGGVVLFDSDVALNYAERNIRTPEQLKSLILSLQRYSSPPLFVCIDQEGGKVARLKEKYGFPRNVSQQYLGEVNNPDTTRYYAAITAKTLFGLGINVNFSPVVDLNTNPENPVIGKIGRSFSADPNIVTSHAQYIIDEHHKQNIKCTLKHFPGHGSSTGDSHLGFVDVTNTWSETELEPFKNIIAAGKSDFVMTAHIYNSKLDPEYPATLSNQIITGILRNEMKFKGIIISDDMTMKAITDNYGFETAVEKSINAGVDILLFGNNLIYDELIASKAIEVIKKLISEGKITESRIDESYQRIIKMKNKYLL